MTRGRHALAVLLLALACHVGADTARVLEGRVLRVQDGDSFELRAGSETLRVRVAHIDAPERDQPWADRSKQALVDRIAGRDVRVRRVDVDAYGRVVGEVFAGDVCVGCEQVRAGNAWVYRKYARDGDPLYALEADARAAKRGLWSLAEDQRTPPWEWRVAHRAKEAPGGHAHAKSACDPPPTCSPSLSCEEARRLLAKCGPVGLDGDGDGVPCERQCAAER